MDTISRDVFRSLIKYFDFKQSRSLVKLSKRWNLLYDSEDGQWRVWCQEQFGDIHPDTDMPDFCTFPDRWKLLFKMFWSFRSRATKMMKKRYGSIILDKEILKCWYYRSKNKPTIYASNLVNRASLRHGDILVDDNYQIRPGSMFLFVYKTEDTCSFLPGPRYELSIPSEFTFPDFPLDYFLITGINRDLHIRITAEDLTYLTFNLNPNRTINYYEDPRAPGIRFVTKVSRGYLRPTPETLIITYMANSNDMISVTCDGITDSHCFINML